MFKHLVFQIIFLTAISAFSQTGNVKLGIDLVVENDFEVFSGKRLAILSNNAGRDSRKKLTVELFVNSPKCSVVAIFAPEHGFKTWVKAGQKVKDDILFGLPVFSLYGNNRRPQKGQLANVDMVIVDLQDIGIRSYTYISTVYNMMDACAEWGIPIVILDRPNPIGGNIVDGNTLEEGMKSFVGIIPVSYIHGCTIGELAQIINEEGWLPANRYGIPRKCNLSIIPIENWKRDMTWEETGLPWTPTSPNIPTVDAVRGCAMTGILGELGIFHISLGATLPFQYFGKIKFDNIHSIISALYLPGIILEPVYRETTTGIKFVFEKNSEFAPYSSGIKVFMTIKSIQPELFDKSAVKKDRRNMFDKVTGTKALFDAMFDSQSTDVVMRIAQKGLNEFKQLRLKYLIYD